jgi:hypothetical protein
MKRKLVSMLLCMMIVLMLIPSMALAADSGSCGDHVTWTLDGGTLTISGTGAMTDFVDYMTDDGYYHSGHAPWYESRDSITSVVIQNGVTHIGENAFQGCSNLPGITIPASVTSIGEWAFYGCAKLDNVTIPNTVTTIGQGAFGACSGLTSVTISNNLGYIPQSMFQECSALTSVTIPDSVTSISIWAFSGCTNLTSVTIPVSVMLIEDAAFSNCTNLTNIDYAGSEASWQKVGIGNNDVLSEATISYGGDADVNSGKCGENLTWKLDNGKLTISGTGAMRDYRWTPWFQSRESITSVVIEDGVTSISYCAFDWCSNLPSITIPNSVTYIGDGAFEGCSSITSITIPNGITSIGAYTFNYCEKLTSVTIPQSVTSIGKYAFANCEKLKNVYYSGKLTDWQNIAVEEEWNDELKKATVSHIHTPGAVTRENEVAATCTTEGSYDEVVRCTVCGEEVNNEKKTIEKIAHTVVTDAAVEATCGAAGKTEGSHCSVCNTVIKAQEEVPATGNHTYGDWEITKEPTATTAGEQTKTCSVCGDKQTEAIPNTTQTTLTALNEKESVTPAEVHEALKDTTKADLRKAISADKGEDGGIISQIKDLEAKIANVTAAVDVDESVTDFAADKVTIVGAKLNVEAASAENPATVTLKIAAAEGNVAVADTYDSSKTVKFSMSLDGVDTLTIPVQVTLPIPSGIDRTKLVILHYSSDGTVAETLQGDDLQITGDSSQYYVSFVLDHFSDFAMTQTKTTTPAAGGGGGTVTTYTVTTATATNGKVTVSPTSAAKGATVTITVTPNSGYAVDKITVTDANGKSVTVTEKDGKYTFSMPAAKVTVAATFKAADQTATTTGTTATNFSDVAAGAWYEEAVQYAQTKGLMNGETATEFRPNNNMTRAMLMTVLARLDGTDTTGGATWYEKGMNWAISKNVSDGSDPNGNITREQLATMLYRYAGTPDANGTTASFKDSAKISDFAAEAMNWAVGAGLLNGNDDGTLNPGGNATRAEVATILMRFIENVAK